MKSSSTGRAVFGAGIVLAVVFLALAPALPLRGVLERYVGARAEALANLVGLAALFLILAGYPLYRLSGAKGEERAIAIFDVAKFLTFAVLMGIVVTISELLDLEGFRGVLIGMLAGSPWLALAYLAYLRRLGERARMARIRIVLLRIRVEKGEEREHKPGD